MTRRTTHRRSFSCALGVLLLTAATSCQEPNPEFGGPVQTEDTGAPSTTTSPETGEAGTDTPMETGPATGSAEGTTTGTPGSTGQPATTTGPADSSSGSAEESTGGCTMCGSECVDTQTDPDNCGECDNRCNPAQEQCVDGMCVPN